MVVEYVVSRMTLPPIIELRVSSPVGGDLSGLIFQLRVTSGTKNSYDIHFPKTAADGTAQITAEDFRGQFTDHHEMGLMDYNGSIESAADTVCIELFDVQRMLAQQESLSLWPLLPHERQIWRSRREFMEYFLSSRNREFCFSEQLAQIPEDGIISLTVERKT